MFITINCDRCIILRTCAIFSSMIANRIDLYPW